ncbi:MAG: hypothetical protein ACYTGN_03110 [Planctomycetota bacterium]
MAKIFVVVNLILGVAAFGSAATLLGAKEDYKAANKTLVENFDNYKTAMQAENDRLETEKGQQINVASQAQAARTTAETSNEDLKRQLAEAAEANKKLLNTIQANSKQAESLQAANAAFKEWLEKYANEAGAATKDKLNFKDKWEKEVANRVRLEAEVSKTAEERDSLAATGGNQSKELKNLKFWLNEYRKKFGDITEGPKGAAGVVKKVRDNFVSISVGSGDGVKVGDNYGVRRGATYVGRIRITRVYKDMAVGEFDDQFKGPGAPPQAGDIAEPEGG